MLVKTLPSLVLRTQAVIRRKLYKFVIIYFNIYPDPPGGVQVPPPARVPPGGVPSQVPPQGVPWLGGVPGQVPPLLPHGILGNVAKHYGIWVPPPCGQTDGWMEGQTLVKTLPSLVLRTRAVITTPLFQSYYGTISWSIICVQLLSWVEPDSQPWKVRGLT